MYEVIWVTIYVRKVVYKSGGMDRKRRRKTYLKAESRCIRVLKGD